LASSALVDIASLITSTPGVQGGQLCLAGTRIRVLTIAAMASQGADAEQILTELPHLDLARIHAALAYYFANKEQVDAELDAERHLGADLAARYLLPGTETRRGGTSPRAR
jgi:uncharacterized protein (DUF433 family)